MSRSRILAKVRKNPDFIAATRELDALGIAWTLRPPISTGHPYLLIGGFRKTIASSPRGGLCSEKVVGDLRRWLREHGLLV